MVWYRWHGGDGPIDFTATSHHGFGPLDSSDSNTHVAVAGFDVANPFNPLAVADDGVAASIIAYATKEYFVAVFSFAGTLACSQASTVTRRPARSPSYVEWPELAPRRPSTTSWCHPGQYARVHQVLANDNDPDGDPITFVDQQSQPSHGSATVVDAAGVFLYQPDSGFQGTDSFDYAVADDSLLESTATVTITVGGTPAPPSNDDFDNARLLAGLRGGVRHDRVGHARARRAPTPSDRVGPDE